LAFAHQTLCLLLDALSGSGNPAFEPGACPLSYGVVTLTVFALGFGLVRLGHRVRGHSLARSAEPEAVVFPGAGEGAGVTRRN
jgi:hypothetical protein